MSDVYYDPTGPIRFNGGWDGKKLTLEVEELNVLADNYDERELVANLESEIARAMRENPLVQRISGVLPYIHESGYTVSGTEAPIETRARTAKEMADVIVAWLAKKLHRAVGEENLVEAEAHLAGLQAMREYDDLWGWNLNTGPDGRLPFANRPAARPPNPRPIKPIAELEQAYIKWMTDQGLDPGPWMNLAEPVDRMSERTRPVDLPDNVEKELPRPDVSTPSMFEEAAATGELIAGIDWPELQEPPLTHEEWAKIYGNWDEHITGSWNNFVDDLHAVAHGLIAGGNEVLELFYIAGENNPLQEITESMAWPYFEGYTPERLYIPNLPEPTTERGKFISWVASWFTPGAGIVKIGGKVHKGVKVLGKAFKDKRKAQAAAVARKKWYNSLTPEQRKFADNPSLVAKLDFTSPKDQAVFWSGFGDGGRAGGQRASANKGVTLEMLAEKYNLPPCGYGIPEAMEIWAIASAKFAESASGTVRAYLRQPLSPNSFWLQVERDRLLVNTKVTQIIEIDSLTLVEKTIYP